MQLETVAVPRPGVGEVIVRVHASGINFNHIWACRGKPVPQSALHPDDPCHIGGSDASGVVAAIRPGVQCWNVGDEIHPSQPELRPVRGVQRPRAALVPAPKDVG
jgi:crotonyl-CoA carboxylase/reductase